MELNSTTITSGSERPATSLPPCTTTVTSILGEQFTPRVGSCSHTLTVTSTIQPTESKTQTIPSETTSLINPTITLTSTSSGVTISSTTLESLRLTTSTTKVDEPIAQIPPLASSLRSSTKADCVTTVTSILGEFLVLGTGSCSQTFTIISTIKAAPISEPTSSRIQATDPASSASEAQTPVLTFSPLPSTFRPTGASTSPTSVTTPIIPVPEPCTATVTSILGKPFVPLPGLCSQTITVVTSPVQVTTPQASFTSIDQPPQPINTSTGPSTSPADSTLTSTAIVPAPPPQQTESSSSKIDPVIVTPVNTLIVPTTTEQLSQPTPETSTSLVPIVPIPPIPATTSDIPQSPNRPPTSPPAISIQTTTPPLSSPATVPATQEPQTPPASSGEPTATVCTTDCTEPQPTNQHESFPTTSPDVPIQTSVATESQVLPSTSEQRPTATQESGFTSTERVSTPLATPTPSIPSITNTPTQGAIIIGSQTISQDTASNFIFGSQTLVPGSAITVNGQQVSAASGGAIILNPVPPKPTPSSPAEASTGAAPAVVVVDGTSITGNTASGFIVGTQTLYPGSAITASGQVITLPSPNPTPAPTPTQNQGPETVPVILIGSSTFTQNSASAFIIGSQTLSPGSAVTISGQVISLSPTGNAVIVNGATATRNPTTFSTEIQAPVTSLVVVGQTLTAGGRVTVGGDVLSLAGGAITVIGTVTVGGGEATATATPTGKKKSSGVRLSSSSWIYIAVEIFFVFGMGAFGLF